MIGRLSQAILVQVGHFTSIRNSKLTFWCERPHSQRAGWPWWPCSHPDVAWMLGDASWVVSCYNKFLASCQLERGTIDQTSNKHDASADWNAWLAEVPLNFTAITGPSAPHHFRICRRCHLSSTDLANAKLTYCSQLREADSQDDLMLALYQFMSDPQPYQVVKLFSPSECRQLRSSFSIQPGPGDFPRRPISQTDRENVFRKAKAAYEEKSNFTEGL